MYTFLCYDKCSTCKKAEKWLKENNISYEKRAIKENNPNTDELKKWRELSGYPLKKFFNTSGQLYREMNLKEKLKDMSEEQMYEILQSDGMLVKRPVIFSDEVVLIGFKESEWQERLCKQS